MSLDGMQKSTIGVWGGEEQPLAFYAAQVPVVLSAPYSYPTVEEWLDAALGRSKGHIYSRNTNPTVAVFEEKVQLLEHAEAAVSFASGMAAVSNVLLALLKPGDRVVSVKHSYGATSKIFLDVLPRFGIATDLVDTDDHASIVSAISSKCDLVYVETPTNPTLKIIDIEGVTRAAKAAGAITVVDNTLATPINQNPLLLGADLALHSATKFLGGHDDALGGVLAGSTELIKKVYHYREITGAALGAFPAYLLLRGMKTLALRVERQNATALAIARHLESHPKVEQVFYPGLRSDRGHDVASRQMSGFGGVLSFNVKGNSFDAARRFLNKLRLAQRAASLGSVNTVAGTPATTSHVECSAAERARLGIPEGLVRFSCGLEDVGDLVSDIEQGLKEL